MSNYSPQSFHPHPTRRNISCKRCPASLLSSEKGKTPKHLPLHQPRGLALPPLPETPTGRVWTRYTAAPTGGSKLSRKKTVTSSLCAITTNSIIFQLAMCSVFKTWEAHLQLGRPRTRKTPAATQVKFCQLRSSSKYYSTTQQAVVVQQQEFVSAVVVVHT